MTFFSSSYNTSTKAPPIPLSTLDQAPLKNALPPSSRAILRQQSIVPVYMISAGKEKNKNQEILVCSLCIRKTQSRDLEITETSPPLRPDCIIMRLRTVSKGYEVRPATAVTVCAIIQLTNMWVFLGSGSMPVNTKHHRLKIVLLTKT